MNNNNNARNAIVRSAMGEIGYYNTMRLSTDNTLVQDIIQLEIEKRYLVKARYEQPLNKLLTMYANILEEQFRIKSEARKLSSSNPKIVELVNFVKLGDCLCRPGCRNLALWHKIADYLPCDCHVPSLFL